MPMTAHVDAAIDNSMLGPLGGASESEERSLVGERVHSGPSPSELRRQGCYKYSPNIPAQD